MRKAQLDQDTVSDAATADIDSYATLIRLFKLLKPFLPLLALAMLLTLGMTGVAMIIPHVAGSVVDSSLTESNIENINWVALYLLSLIAVMALFRYFSAYLLGKVGASFLRKLRELVFGHIVRLSLGFFQRRQVGELNARIVANLDTMQDLLTNYALAGMQSVLQIVGVIIMLFYINTELTLVALSVSIPIVLMTSRFGNLLESAALRVNDELADSSANVEEVFRGINTVQAFGNETEELTRYRNIMDRVFDSQVVQIRRESAYLALMDFLGYAAIALVLWYGGRQVLADELTIGQLTACLMYMLIFSISVVDVGELIANVNELTGVSHRIFQILDEKSDIQDHGDRLVDGAEAVQIEFQEVSFSYPSDLNKLVLEDFSLKIDAGEDIAIVGPAGSGKSTILRLMFRFHDVEKGEIRLNNHPIHSYKLGEFRKLFGYCSQDVFLFSGTVLDNIRYGYAEASLSDVKKAIEAIGATEFVDNLPNGLQEDVGVAGSKLSGGQKQLLGLSRVYLSNPSILLLDEATSALDSESEKRVQASLNELKAGRTTLTIAHRLATVCDTEKIILLEHGRIAAVGSHDRLLETSELYNKYWHWQSRGFQQKYSDQQTYSNSEANEVSVKLNQSV